MGNGARTGLESGPSSAPSSPCIVASQSPITPGVAGVDAPFAALPEQTEAKRLLTAALGGGDAHAFLFHGPAGVGKTEAAFAFAGARLGDARRVVDRTHPDLRIVEPLGDMIRIDVIRELPHY